MQLIIAGLCTLLLGLVLTFTVCAVAHGMGVVAAPRPDRWHQKPTPTLGGVAIYVAFMAGYVIFARQLSSAYPILAAGTLLFITGLIDDNIRIKPYTKLIVQLIAAAVIAYFGLHLPWTNVQAIRDVITIFWLVGITNAINLLDNMDGLAAGVSLIACAFLATTLLLNGQTAEAALPIILGGVLLGFLAFNFNPASIFMGDCGSMFVGVVLGGAALLSDYDRSRNLTSVLLTPVLLLMIPIFDTCIVTVTRKLSGRPIFQGGRDHMSHRLVALGMAERRAVIMLYAIAAFSGALALMVRWLRAEVIFLVVPGFALMILFLGLYLGKVRIYDVGQQEQPGSTIIKVLVDLSYKRRVFEVLLDVVLVVLACYGAYVLRWDADLPGAQLAIFARTLPLVIVIQMSCFLLGGVYQGLWRYVGIDELIVIAKAVLAGTAASSVVVLAMYEFHGPSRAVFVVYMLLLFVFVGASRLSFRLLRAFTVSHANGHANATPVLIYGAGDAGEILIREILNNSDHRYVPVGFIDDDVRKAGKLIHGHRIFGTHYLPDLIRKHGVRAVLISSEKVPESKLDSLRNMGLNLKRMSIRIE